MFTKLNLSMVVVYERGIEIQRLLSNSERLRVSTVDYCSIHHNTTRVVHFAAKV